MVNFLSEDGGATWNMSSDGYTGALLRQIDVAANDRLRVYNASRMGIFASQDGGEKWTGTSYAPARAPEGIVVAVDPFDAAHILEVLIDAGPNPAVSHDGGKSWKFVDTGLWPEGSTSGGLVTRIVFSSHTQDLVLATAGERDCYANPSTCLNGSGYGIIRSEDGGETWAKTSLTDAQVFDIKFINEKLAYAVAYPDTLYRSQDNGRNWEIIAQGMSSQISIPNSDPDIIIQPILISVAAAPDAPDTILAGFANGGVMLSTDAGQTWSIAASGLTPETYVMAIEADPVHQGVFYLGSSTSGVYYTLDSGQTWTALNTGLTTRAVTDLALASDGSLLYAATSGGGVFRLGELSP